MGARQRKTGGWLLPLVALAIFALYVGTYSLTGEDVICGHGEHCRVYRWQWQAQLYRPAVAVQSWVTGRDVIPASRG